MGQPGQLGSQFGGDDWIVRKLQDLERAMRELAAADLLATAGIGVIPDGVIVNGLMEFRREDGTLGVKVDPTTGTFVAYNAAGTTAVARFGSLVETAPGSYGVEVLVGSTWVQVGAQTTTWDSVSGKPTDFGPLVTSPIGQAEGSQYGWTNNVGGTEFYALWVGNNTGYKFGRNVSSVRYKMNIRAHHVDPAKVLQLTPVLYDRIPTPPLTATTNEFGLIAEQVAEFCPELVTWFNGEIDSVRYDLLVVALLSVVKHQDAQIKALAAATGVTLPAPANVKPNVPSSMAPAVEPEPLPYTIQES